MTVLDRSARRRLTAWLVPLAAASCFSTGGDTHVFDAGPARGPHATSEDAWSVASRAQALQQIGRNDEANALLGRAIEQDPLFVPAQRLRQNWLRENGRAGLAWAEVAQLAAAHPDRSEPLYLASRLVANLTEKRKMIAHGLARFPDSYWLRYAWAWVLSNDGAKARGRATRILRDLSKLDIAWPPLELLARETATSRLTPSKRLPRYLALSQRFPEDGRLDFLIYRAGTGQVARLLGALEKAPRARGLLAWLGRQTITAGHGRTVVRWLGRHAGVAQRLIENRAGFFLAKLALSEGEVDLAERWLRETLVRDHVAGRSEWRGRSRSPLRTYMSLLLQRADLGAAIDVWSRRLRVDLLDDGRSRIAPRLKPLIAGPLRELHTTPPDADVAARMLRVLLRAGWVDEVSVLGRVYAKTHPHDAAIGRLIDEADDFLVFEEGFSDFLAGPGRYQQLSGGLDAVLERLRELSKRLLGRDVVGRPRQLTFPIVGGRLLDPFGPGLPAWFDRYNRHLILGSLMGKRPSVLLGIKLREARVRSTRDLPLNGECWEVVIEDKLLSTAAEIGISDPAGIALWNHYVVDMRSVRNWMADLAQTIDRVGVQGYDAVAADPFPRVPALDLSRPAQVNWKLTARAARDGGWNRDRLWRELFGLLRRHEHAHLVDAHRFLPVGTHIGPALWLFSAAGFSSKSLQANLEGRAECAALAYGADPHLALAHLAVFISDLHQPGTSLHQVGFRRVLRRLIELWHADGAPGARDAHHNLLAQLHLMPPALAVTYAKKVLGEEGF